jgi:ATP-dependent protease ClpP protease subunit
MQRQKHPFPLEVKGRTITVMGEVGWDFSAKDLIEYLLALGNTEPIELLIMSEGGTVAEATAVYDFVRVNNYNVTTSVYGYAASAATVLALCGRRVRMGQSAIWMVHSPYFYEFVPTTSMPEEGDMEETDVEDGYKKPKMNGEMENGVWVKRIETTFQTIIADIYARKTGGTREEMLALMKLGDDTNKLYNAEETLALGFIDEILVDATATAAAFMNQFTYNKTNLMNLFARMAAMLGQKPEETTEDAVVAELQSRLGALDAVKADLETLKSVLATANDPGDTQPEPEPTEPTEPVEAPVNAEVESLKNVVAELTENSRKLAAELAEIKAKGPASAPIANGIVTGEHQTNLPKSQQERIAELWAKSQASKS